MPVKRSSKKRKRKHKKKQSQDEDEDDKNGDISFSVKLVYASAVIIWIYLILWLCLYKAHCMSVIILTIPFILFATGFFNSSVVTEEVERSVFKTNYAGVGFLFLVPLLAWVSKGYDGDSQWFITILMVSIILILLSLVDIWVQRKWMRTYRHAISTLQTMALFLVIYSLHEYYLTCPNHIGSIC